MINQFKQKKKRVMNPDIPRPNLMTHEKKLKDAQIAHDELIRIVQDQHDRIRILSDKLASMTRNYENMQSSINMLIGYMRRKG